MAATCSSVRNRLLLSLRPEDLARLAPHLERRQLERGAALFEPGQELRWVWFPESGVVSLLVAMGEGGSAEAATVGSEGAVGLVSALGGRRGFAHAVVQVPGAVLALPSTTLAVAFEASAGLRRRCWC